MISPGREDILDAVGAIGPSSVSDLGAFIGRSRHALYYHVRALRDCGLLVETHHSDEGKKTTARYDLPGRPLHVRYDLSTEKSKQAVIALARTRLRSASRGFVRACGSGISSPSGSERNLWVARWKGWLSPKDLKEANQLLWRLVKLLRHESVGQNGKRICHEFTFALAPIVPQPVVVGAVPKNKLAKRRKSTRDQPLKGSRPRSDLLQRRH
jgi:biotin operon repressor